MASVKRVTPSSYPFRPRMCDPTLGTPDLLLHHLAQPADAFGLWAISIAPPSRATATSLIGP